jgi:hypothetical protein
MSFGVFFCGKVVCFTGSKSQLDELLWIDNS